MTCARRVVSLWMAIGAIALASGGCAYLKDRGNDALDMIDIGFSFSKKPQFAFYYDFVPIIPIGLGYVEGNFAGLGGGKAALWTPHVERSLGAVLWGQEELAFGVSPSELDAMTEEQRNEALHFQRTGLLGMGQGPFPGPEYLISCPHYIHLGWIGVVGTPRYLHMLDFVLGWTTLDICGDDEAGKSAQPPQSRPAGKKPSEQPSEQPSAEK